MAEHTSGLFGGPPDGVVSWLTWGAVGPAAVALPVNWAADKLAAAAVQGFRWLLQNDDLSRLVKAAGTSIPLNRAEISAVRKLLGDEETWRQLGKGDVTRLSDQIADRLPPQDGRTAEDSRNVAGIIARGLLEFAVFKLDPKTFQKVVLVRLGQMNGEVTALNDQVTALNEALFRAHKYLYHSVDDAGVKELFKLVMARLPPEPADLHDVRIYLDTLIKWLKKDPWPRDNRIGPADIERKLRVSLVGPARGPDLDADELGRRCSRLVILGGTGSGKTWLAMRTARICAEEALKALDDEATLDEVELPLYTTCSHLVEEPGSIREAVVSSAIKRIGDLGGARIIEALRLLFTERDKRTLLVIDSLDEADADKARDRLSEADSLRHPWRVALTSRPSSWMNQFNIEEGNQDHQVGELQPLRYPGDVEAVIQCWFKDNKDNRERGQALAKQIAGQPSLQQAATVPLILAYYCILGGSQPLPEFRYDLYQKIIECMLRAPWRSNKRPSVDKKACRDALRNWAWQGATKDDPVSGVGQWEDDIPAEQARLSSDEQVAVDHVAVPRSQTDLYTYETTSRRFVHRSIREHLVADYVADLPVNEAVAALLPHLWYDADWEYAAPAAIAMHARRAKQAKQANQANHDEVLRALLCRAANEDEIPGDLSVIDAGGEVRKLLAWVAAESREDDWSPKVAGIIGQAREELARSGIFDDFHGDEFDKIALGSVRGMLRPDVLSDLGAAAHWSVSNCKVRKALLEELTGDANGWEAVRLAGTLIQLNPPPGEKDHARVALLKRLGKSANDWEASRLVDMLIQLDPPPGDEHEARVALLRRREQEAGVGEVAGALAQLGSMPEEEDQAIGTLLGFLAGGNAWTDGAGQASGTATAELADLVAQLEPEPDDERGTLDAITDLLDTGTASKAAALVAQLDPGDKRRARRALLALLTHHTTGAGLASKVAALVALLDPEPDEKRETLEVVLTLLRSQTGGLACADMATTVLQLDPEPGDKSRARRALIALLTSYANGAVAADEAMLWRLADNDKGSLTAKLVALVIQLHPTPGDKRRALNVVLTLLEGQATDAAAVSLAAMMAQLDPTPGDKRRALDAVLKLLDDPATDAAAVRQVVNLVRPDLLADHTEGRDADGLAATLIQLDPTPGDKHQARLALLRRLTKSDHPWTASQLADDLTRLDATAEEKHRACEALLGRLKGRPWLVSVVVQLASTPGDKRQVLDALLCLLDLEETGSGAAGQLIDGMAQLDPTALDLSRSRRWAALPTRELLAAVRRNSSLDEWLEVLPLIAAGS